MPRATKTKVVGGRVVSAKSKTGNPACSAATSAWVRGRKTGGVSSEVYKVLAKCRAQARQNKQASQKQESGKLAAGRGTWQRSEAAKALLQQRAARVSPQQFATRVKQAAAAVPASKRFGGKAFIHHVHEQYQKAHGPVPLEHFKRGLAEANHKGHLQLSRADLPAAHSKADVAASKLTHQGADFNFVRVPGGAASNEMQQRAQARSARLERAGAKTGDAKGVLAYKRVTAVEGAKAKLAAARAARAAKSTAPPASPKVKPAKVKPGVSQTHSAVKGAKDSTPFAPGHYGHLGVYAQGAKVSITGTRTIPNPVGRGKVTVPEGTVTFGDRTSPIGPHEAVKLAAKVGRAAPVGSHAEAATGHVSTPAAEPAPAPVVHHPQTVIHVHHHHANGIGPGETTGGIPGQ